MEFSKQYWLNLIIGISFTLFSAGLMYLELSPLETLEAKLFDYRLNLRGSLKPPDNIVIAAIDERSIERIGRWPWDRDTIAALVNKMNDAGAEIIMFDAFFSEVEKNDLEFAGAIHDAGNVILPLVFEFDKKKARQENEALLSTAFKYVSNKEVLAKYTPIKAETVLMPVNEIGREAMALGHINMNADADGTLRWETMAVLYQQRLYPSIALQVAAKYLGVPPEFVTVTENGIILGKKRFIPTTIGGQSLINYYGGRNTFPYISLSDIYEGNVSAEQLEGKIVLVGALAKGLFDLRVTPFSAEMPGVEKHASVIASILENKLLSSVKPFVNRSLLLVSGAVFSLLISSLILRFKIIGVSGITLISLALLFFSAHWLFIQKGLWVNVTYPTLNILGIAISVTAYNYAVEERFARRIRAMFSSYVTERVVNELIKNPKMARLGGERREISVLFSDVRGFTTFSEKHAPEEVVAILNEYLGEMTSIVLKWEGTLDKFIGDAILAFWGAPMKQENHAELAVKCALDMIDRLNELRRKWQEEGKEGLDIGIGINTGEVIVGNIGAEGKKMDYTVIGDHVNLGSRIESLTKKYKAHILITEFTFQGIEGAVLSNRIGHVSIRGLDRVVVKGKEKPVAIYEIASLEAGLESFIEKCDESCVIHMKEK